MIKYVYKCMCTGGESAQELGLGVQLLGAHLSLGDAVAELDQRLPLYGGGCVRGTCAAPAALQLRQLRRQAAQLATGHTPPRQPLAGASAHSAVRLLLLLG